MGAFGDILGIENTLISFSIFGIISLITLLLTIKKKY